MNRQPSPADRLRSASVPRPPAALRARTLAVAEHAMGRAPADLWTKTYRSRPLRVAWSCAVILLVAAHVAVSVDRGDGHTPETVVARPEIDGWSYVSGYRTSSARSADLASIEDDVALWTSRHGGIPQEKLR